MDAASTRYSIIIPLEYHRGVAERCVRAWLAQTHSAELVELVLAVPDDFPRAELATLRALLRRRDRILRRPERHDMGLVVAGAAAATHEILFFTESHCWPEPDVLARVAAALAAHPGWAGLSCRSLPVIANRLAAVEARMYQRDIEAAMRHPWRRILDQCFAVRRAAYERAGGFEAELGHFAEWVLAARFHRLGLELGYLPEAGMHHLYIGQLAVWRDFTEDFIDGEMRFHTRAPRDPCADLFPAVEDWEDRHGWDPGFAVALLRVLAQEPRRALDAGPIGLVRRLAAPAGITPWWLAALARERLVRLAVAGCRVAVPRALPHALGRYVGAVALARRLAFLRRRPAPTLPPPAAGLEWFPGDADDRPIFGFHGRQDAGGETFRWSRPLAMIGFSLAAGSYTLEIALAPLRSTPAAPRFYLNGARVAAGAIEARGERIRLTLPDVPAGVNRLAWVCAPFHPAGEARALGLPVRGISMTRLPAARPLA